MIANKDNYLLLKQLAVILETLSMNAEVVNGNRAVTIEGTLSAIVRTLDQIEVNFTIPYALLQQTSVGINLLDFVEPIRELSQPNVQGDALEQLRLVDTPDGINNCINKFPIMRPYLDVHAQAVSAGKLWECGRADVAKLIQVTSDGLQSVQYWTENSTGRTLIQILVLINMIELVDRLFAFLNDYYGAENDHS